jgi:Skp family chaperone for outer membrane proteins
MKTKILLFLTVILTGSISASAQTGGAAPTASGGQIPKMKVAIVDVLAFRESITELKAKYDKLQTEFAPRYQELEAMQSKLAAQEKTLAENKNLTPQQAAKLSEEFDQGKKDYQRRLDDAQTLARKREAQETEAISDKLSKFMDQFCQKNGITTVFDARRLQETGIVIYALPAANITDIFIKEYNKANPGPPATAAKP